MHVNSSLGTKRSALETLRKMAKTLLMGGPDVISHELMKDFQEDPAFEDSMCHVIQAMNVEERAQMCRVNDGEILDKLDELVRLSRDHCVLEGLPKVKALIQGTATDGDSEDAYDEEDDNTTAVSEDGE